RNPSITHDEHGSHIAVAEHRALGFAGGTGGVQNQSDIVAGDLREGNDLAGTTNGAEAQSRPRDSHGGIASYPIALVSDWRRWYAQEQLAARCHRVCHIDGMDGQQRSGPMKFF